MTSPSVARIVKRHFLLLASAPGPAIVPKLHPDTYDKVQGAHPTLDTNNIAELEQAWRAWLTKPGKTRPQNPDTAFLAFCRRKMQEL
jgi:hypothetical protein